MAKLEELVAEAEAERDLDNEKETQNLNFGELSVLVRDPPRRPVGEKATEAYWLEDGLDLNK